jgi:hypothetical protein
MRFLPLLPRLFVGRTEYERIFDVNTGNLRRAEAAEYSLGLARQQVEILTRNVADMRIMLDNAEKMRAQETKRADAADVRAASSFDSAIAAIGESRAAVTQASEITKTATAMILGPIGDAGEVGIGTTVGEADRKAAVRAREQGEEEARRRS